MVMTESMYFVCQGYGIYCLTVSSRESEGVDCAVCATEHENPGMIRRCRFITSRNKETSRMFY